MDIRRLSIPDVVLIHPRKHEDLRGFFCETFNGPQFEKAGLPSLYVQDNLSLSIRKGTVRGLHFQSAPYAQDKLIRVLKGSIFDVVVDLRKGSPFYGQHASVELSGNTLDQLYVPAGFAHGFCTLEDNTEVFYKVTKNYASAHDGGMAWNDPDLNIAWPVNEREAILSDKDKQLPRFRQLPDLFFYVQRAT